MIHKYNTFIKYISKYLVSFIIIYFTIILLFRDKVRAIEETAYLYPVADAVIFSGEPNTNYGHTTNLEIAYSSSGASKVSFVKFDLSNLPSDATINTAKFWIYLTFCEGTMNPNELKVGQVTTDWTESTLTWSTGPNFIAGPARTASCDSGSWWEFDVESIARNWHAGNDNFGFAIYSASSPSFSRHFYSREYGGTTYQPQLVINFTSPDPVSDEPDTTDEDESQDGDGVLPDSDDTGINDPPPPATSDDESNVSEDESIAAPSLVYVWISSTGQVTDIDDSRTIEVLGDEEVTVVGSSIPGHTLILSVGDEIYKTTVNDKGYWAVTIDAGELDPGVNIVEAQAVKGDVGSYKVFFFNLNVTDLSLIFEDDSDISMDLPIFSPIIGSIGSSMICVVLAVCCPLIVILLIFIIILLIVKRRKVVQQEESNSRK